MTRVDFYILSATDPEARLRFVCRLVEMVYRKRRHRVYIHAESRLQAEELDERLWSDRAASFLPHNLVGDGPKPAPPIQIGHDKPGDHRDVLINLSAEVPAWFAQFERVAEISSQDETSLGISREHYRHYRDRGFPLETHKIEA